MVDRGATRSSRFTHHVDGLATQIDHRSSNDTDIWLQVAAEHGRAVYPRLPGWIEVFRTAPNVQAARVIRVERVHRVVLRSDVNHVMSNAGDGNLRCPQRLRINRSIHCAGKYFSKVCRIY